MKDKIISTVPKHVGLILDGNRRWAVGKGLSQLQGHKKGYANLKKIGKYGLKKGVNYLSAYVFSTENWNRSKEEVKYLMDLSYWVAKNEMKELTNNNIRVRWIGSNEGVEKRIIDAMKEVEEVSKNNTGGTLGLCFNYGGHLEIADAVKTIVKSKVKAEDINESIIEQNLYASDIPPIDLLIRTSGEKRISNFMLWRAAYSELYFIDKHWPDFTEKDLDDALTDYANRQRRFGQ